MKHFFKYYFFLMLVIMGTVAMSSCNKNDNDDSTEAEANNPNPTALVGNWLCQITYSPSNIYYCLFELKSNGTGRMFVGLTVDYEWAVHNTSDITWSVSDNKITIKYSDKTTDTGNVYSDGFDLGDKNFVKTTKTISSF